MEDKANSGNTSVEAAETTSLSAKKTPKSSSGSKSKDQREKTSHPPTSEMVCSAIKELKKRNGSSLQAIKKYIASTYKVDGEKIAPFIKRYLKSAVTSGDVVQTKGKGASGSFKLPTEKSSDGSKAKKVPRPARKTVAKKEQSVEKKSVSKKTSVKKPVAAKKTAVERKYASPKAAAAASKVTAKLKAATETKSISKSKKAAKTPPKTKTPKPKKATNPKAVKSPAKK